MYPAKVVYPERHLSGPPHQNLEPRQAFRFQSVLAQKGRSLEGHKFAQAPWRARAKPGKKVSDASWLRRHIYGFRITWRVLR